MQTHLPNVTAAFELPATSSRVAGACSIQANKALRVLLAALLTLGGAAVHGLDPSASKKQAEQNQAGQKQTEVEPVPFTHLSERTDAELTGLTARWDQLTAAQRRVLLAEVRGRMARSRANPRQLRERVMLGRQYGQISRKPVPNRVLRKTTKVRQADGSVVVRTEVVRVTPDGKATGMRSTVHFGVGFERRNRPQQRSVQDLAQNSADATEKHPDVTDRLHIPAVKVTEEVIVPAPQN